ncbi:AfsR/SARP family transcriptional regulator [Nonomuraea sediminis]|uniref:AfsR/SARP family transcriptional regulator n=1 Tax=Nonomuraea sediminis TaxID=2835864 RepID=UPI001BDDC385|nr:AfsR/SARP family transcriptional regulator [Nonomuraea sediminis]
MSGNDLRFGILGALEVVNGERHLSLRSSKQRSLLAMLLCHPGTVAVADHLIDALWGAEAGDAGSGRLRLQLHRLRRALGAVGVIAHESTGYTLRVGPDAVDAWRFERLVHRGQQALASGNVAKGRDLLRSALALWRGPALSGLDDIPFLHRQSTRLEEVRLAALADRIDADLRLRRHAEVIGELTVLVKEHPLRETFRGQLMIALYRGGRQAEALEVYRDGRRILSEELGLEPSPDLRRLEVAILTSDSSLSAARPPGPRTAHRRIRHSCSLCAGGH